MIKIKDLHNEWLKDEEYQQEYEKLEAEFNLAKTLIQSETQLNRQHGRTKTSPISSK